MGCAVQSSALYPSFLMNSNSGDGGWQVTYAVLVIVSWLPVPIHLAEPALFSACNLVLLVSTG